VQLSIVLLVTLAAYLGVLNLAALGVPGLDKVLHFCLVGALAFFSVGWWADRSPWRVLLILSIVAIVDETGQSFSAVRSFSLVDLAANLLGILVFGHAAAWLVHRRAVHLRRAT
jgi:VanZ family protein